MADTNKVINGTDVHGFISDNGTTWAAVLHATNMTLNIDMKSRDTSNKGTGNFVTKASGRLDVSGTIEGMYIDEANCNYEYFMTTILGRLPVYLCFSGAANTETSNPVGGSTLDGGSFYMSGKFIITKVDAKFPDQENSTYTATFEHYEGFSLNNLYVS